MRTINIVSVLVMFVFFAPMVCLGITNGDFDLGSTGWSEYAEASSSVSWYPSPLGYVRVFGATNETATIWQQETGFGSGETWRATFDINSVTAGLGAIVTIGWTNISGDFGSYYQTINSPGLYNVDCDNSSYPYVSVQCDGSTLMNAIVEVDEIITVEASAPTPTPTATPMTLPGQYTFNSDVEGWSFLPVSGSGFSGASSGYASGRVSINSTNDSTHRVGLWTGPTNIPYSAGYVYRATYTVSSSQATASANPQFRMRWVQDQSLESATQVVNAAASYSNSLPNDPTTAEYISYFAPVLSGNLGAAFDMIDFDVGQYGTHFVDTIAVDRFLRPAAGTTVDSYDSAGEFSNWEFLTNIGYGPVTSGGSGTGTLSITAPMVGDANFGFWQSSGTANEMTYVADKLYRATFTLSCPTTERNAMPQIRLRCQNEDGQMTQTMELNSQGTGPGAMPLSTGSDYDVYWETPTLPGSPGTSEDGFIAVMDVLDFSTVQGGTINLESVAVDYVTIP